VPVGRPVQRHHGSHQRAEYLLNRPVLGIPKPDGVVLGHAENATALAGAGQNLPLGGTEGAHRAETDRLNFLGAARESSYEFAGHGVPETGPLATRGQDTVAVVLRFWGESWRTVRAQLLAGLAADRERKIGPRRRVPARDPAKRNIGPEDVIGARFRDSDRGSSPRQDGHGTQDRLVIRGEQFRWRIRAEVHDRSPRERRIPESGGLAVAQPRALRQEYQQRGLGRDPVAQRPIGVGH